MRYWKLLLMGGIVLALSMPAGAVSVNMNMTDFDEGTQYFVADRVAPYTQAELDAMPAHTTLLDPGTGLPWVGNWQMRPTGGGGSDTWGIFRVENIKLIPGGEHIFDNGATEITAIFWGLQDTYLLQTTAPNGVITQVIHGTGLQAAFFRDTSPGTEWATAAATGPSGWSIVAGKPTYAGITDIAPPIWTMNSTSGWDYTFPTDEFFATFTTGAATLGSSGNMNLDMGSNAWGTGTENWMLNTNSIPGYDLLGNPGKFADVTLHFQGEEFGSNLWLLATSDPMKTDIVPEPVTMASLLLGFGCLGRYIRKRR